MKTMKTLLARVLAARAESSARTTRRALRDIIRREEYTARRHERRARGLRLYAAWSTPSVLLTDPGQILATRRHEILRQALREDDHVPCDILAGLRRVLTRIPRPHRRAV